MELEATYQNVDVIYPNQPAQNRKIRKAQNPTGQHQHTGHGKVRSFHFTKPVHGKRFPPIIYLLQAVSILLSVVIFITAVLLFSVWSTKLAAVENKFQMEISGLQTNFTEWTSKLVAIESKLTEDISGLQRNVTEWSTKLTVIENKFNKEISALQKNVSEWPTQMTTIESKLQLEISGLQRNVTEQSTRLAQIENKFEEAITGLRRNDSKQLCAPGWKYFNSKCYYFSKSLKNWHEANSSCISNQSHLIVIDTAEEQNFIITNIMQQQHWIGLNDLSVKGQWKWIDETDSKTSQTFWANEHLNNGHCVQMRSDGRWENAPCTSNRRWICEQIPFACFSN
ncbi:asialoglycoprotein receptor 1-like [Stegostoma tigrinum]|uniref:asialoglycoprotein receptor 1-like n=1 Tax=Stegostoma tigrinum TaxID=3053191 RepID=UPI00286FF06F|nr:asialoglycoprotein receptor 1-like [Stegostoma tigrinum]